MDMAVAEALPASVPLVSSVGSDNECWYVDYLATFDGGIGVSDTGYADDITW